MNLREVYELMGPLVLRGESPGATAKKLFPNSIDPSSARGLEAYAWNAFATRKEMLESVFPRTRDAIVRTCGERAWLDLGPSFSRAHPATHAKLLRTAEPFPCFLAGRRQIPRWVVELADLELVGRQTYHHPLDDDDSAFKQRGSAFVTFRVVWDSPPLYD